MSEDKKEIEQQLYHDKVQAEINHLLAQTAKVNKETKWYEIVIIVSATLAVVAIVKFLYSAN